MRKNHGEFVFLSLPYFSKHDILWLHPFPTSIIISMLLYEPCSTVYIYHTFFIDSLVDGLLMVNLYVQILLSPPVAWVNTFVLKCMDFESGSSGFDFEHHYLSYLLS